MTHAIKVEPIEEVVGATANIVTASKVKQEILENLIKRIGSQRSFSSCSSENSLPSKGSIIKDDLIQEVVKAAKKNHLNKVKQEQTDTIEMIDSSAPSCSSNNSIPSIKYKPADSYNIPGQYWVPMPFVVGPNCPHMVPQFNPTAEMFVTNDPRFGVHAAPTSQQDKEWLSAVLKTFPYLSSFPPIASNRDKIRTQYGSSGVDFESLKPTLKWREIVELAIICNGNKPTTQVEIYNIIEHHFHYFSLNRKSSSWKSSVRSTVITNKDIEKDISTCTYKIRDDAICERAAAIRLSLKRTSVGIKELDFINSSLDKF